MTFDIYLNQCRFFWLFCIYSFPNIAKIKQNCAIPSDDEFRRNFLLQKSNCDQNGLYPNFLILKVFRNGF